MKYRKAFSFRNHARDYIIGATAVENKGALITYNLDDSQWVIEEGGSVDAPENFLARQIS